MDGLISADSFSFEQLPGELRTLSERELSNARRELELTGKLNPAVILCRGEESDPLRLDDDLAEAFFGSGPRRSVFFRLVRQMVKDAAATAVVLVSDMFMGKPTEKMLALPDDEVKRILAANPEIAVLEKQGLVTRGEAILVTAQTAEKAAMVTQYYERDRPLRRITWGTRAAQCFPQEALQGRMKMYGKSDAAAG